MAKLYSNNTTNLFQKLNTALYFCGMSGFWIEDVKLPGKVIKIYNFISIFIEFFMFVFVVSELGSFVTQNNLTPKQTADRFIFDISHPTLYVFLINLKYYKKNVRDVLYQLAIGLKQVHNDLEVEKQMMKKFKYYMIAFVLSSGLCILFCGASAFALHIRTGAPFTPIITAWPDVDDDSSTAHIARVLTYIFWWIYFSRVSGTYILIFSMFICLGCQYKNLKCYFMKLGDIYKKSGMRADLDREYEAALKVGIKLHADTIWCTQECQKIYGIIFSAQILMEIVDLASVMSQMMTSDRTLVSMGAVVFTTCAAMASAGFIMWNAGDVSVEASYLPNALYACGWQHCEGSTSARTRKLVVLAMTQAQKPVVFTALGCIEISYETYLAIVKLSYSVFSVIY